MEFELTSMKICMHHKFVLDFAIRWHSSILFVAMFGVWDGIVVYGCLSWFKLTKLLSGVVRYVGGYCCMWVCAN